MGKSSRVWTTPTKTSNHLANSCYSAPAKSSKTELRSNTVNSRIYVRTPLTLSSSFLKSQHHIGVLPDPTEYTESTITEVFNVSIGDDPDLGDYRDINGESFFVAPCGNNLIVTYTSYLVLKQAAPEVKPHILYALAFGGNRDTSGEVAGIDYGPVGMIFEQYAYWPAICGDSGGGFEAPHKFWQQLLNDKERSEEDILHDAWRGPGNMWVFVRPDRYVE